ncbi:MAG: radical SAM protein [Victivallales bacterium]|nr:radical SAM protein [Victivallales bacterium]
MCPHPPSHGTKTPTAPRVIAWELTRRCSLQCQHCRGSAQDCAYEGELDTDECFQVLDSIASFAKPVLILTGGEPMMRDDLYRIASHADELGMHPVLAPCGHLITPETAQRIQEAGIRAISISLDGADAASHDAFRGVPGAYERTMQGLHHAIAADIPFQINTTVTRQNVGDLPAILEQAIKLGAKTFDVFFLVPTGRGSGLTDLEVTPEAYEDALHWVAEVSRTAPIRVKTTCAPHIVRVADETGPTNGSAGQRPMGGCLAGGAFVFISHTGILQPCGFLAISCGDLRTADYDFRSLYEDSPVFQDLRDVKRYDGKCGTCRYVRSCGGCRARAYEGTGDYLAEEPRCTYQPGEGRA